MTAGSRGPLSSSIVGRVALLWIVVVAVVVLEPWRPASAVRVQDDPRTQD